MSLSVTMNEKTITEWDSNKPRAKLYLFVYFSYPTRPCIWNRPFYNDHSSCTYDPSSINSLLFPLCEFAKTCLIWDYIFLGIIMTFFEFIEIAR